MRIVRAARRPPSGPDAVHADVRDRASLRRALAGVDAAIVAVGPYEYDPAPLAAACAEVGCHWVDLADRAPFLAAAEAAARRAAAAGVSVVSGAGAAPGLAEAVAAGVAAPSGACALRVWFSVGSRKPVSGALLYALLRPLGRVGEGGAPYPGPVTERALDGARFWFARHPWPRGDGRARVEGGAFPVDYRIGMDHRGQAVALRALAPLLGRLPERWLLRACRAAQPATRAITRLGGARGALAVEWLDAAGAPQRGAVVLAPQGLDLAALPAVWAARALLEGRRAAPGPVAFAALAPREALHAWMRSEGWSVTRL